MDILGQYIKMCDCKEIQGHEKKPLDWSGIQDHYYKGAYSFGLLTDGSYTYWAGSHFIWLPHQDRLQEMVGREVADLVEGLWRFISDTGWDDWKSWFEYVRQFTSMEQLWLAFVMKEKYNKIWNGDEWK